MRCSGFGFANGGSNWLVWSARAVTESQSCLTLLLVAPIRKSSDRPYVAGGASSPAFTLLTVEELSDLAIGSVLASPPNEAGQVLVLLTVRVIGLFSQQEQSQSANPV